MAGIGVGVGLVANDTSSNEKTEETDKSKKVQKSASKPKDTKVMLKKLDDFKNIKFNKKGNLVVVATQVRLRIKMIDNLFF